jgi:hypothetical protein
MENRNLQRAIASLAHPVTLAAITVMLVNDHLLRQIAPSWITGKLSDAAWLVIVPPCLALFLGWLMPRDERSLGVIAIALTGLSFMLIKLTPIAAHITTPIGTFGTRVDPTDLLMLPALAITWLVWQHAEMPGESRIHWLAMVMAVIALTADAPAPDYGVACLSEKDGRIFAEGGFSTTYISKDGGITWQQSPHGSSESCSFQSEESFTLADPSTEQVIYRFSRQRIERSADGGQSWTRELDLRREEARIAASSRGNVYSEHYPMDALFDQETGNLIVAMGDDGVLTRTPDGNWHWIAVGPHHREELGGPGAALSLIIGELALVLVLPGVLLSVYAARFREGRVLAIVMAVLASLPWLASLITSPVYSTAAGYAGPIFVILLVIAAFLSLISGAFGISRLIDAPPGSFQVAARAAALTALLAALPYVLWVLTGALSYLTAMIIALVVAVLGAGAGFVAVRRIDPVAIPLGE